MLRADICLDASYSVCPTLDDMIAKAREREINIKDLRKRKAETRQTIGVSANKPKGFESRLKG